MAYASLGSRRALAAPDTTGRNPGNLTTVFGPEQLFVQVPYFEIYRAVVTDVAPGAVADIYLDAHEISAAWFGQRAEWDPAQPPILSPGQSLYFFWSLPDTTAIMPETTLWFRYDPAFYENP